MGRIWKKASRIDSVFWFSITNRKDSVYISTIACIAWIYLGRPQTSQGQERRRRRIRMGGSIQIRYSRTRSLLVFHAPCLEEAYLFFELLRMHLFANAHMMMRWLIPDVGPFCSERAMLATSWYRVRVHSYTCTVDNCTKQPKHGRYSRMKDCGYCFRLHLSALEHRTDSTKESSRGICKTLLEDFTVTTAYMLFF
jgi:hypothetical protein